LPGQAPNQFLWIYAPKDTRLSIAQNDFQDFHASPDLPEAPAAFDFGQFRHF
jgi:hypothetical protein